MYVDRAHIYTPKYTHTHFPHSSVGKESVCNAGDLGSITGSGRPPGKGNGNPLQCSCLENPMDRGVWWATVHGVQFSHSVMSDSFLTPWTTAHQASLSITNSWSPPKPMSVESVKPSNISSSVVPFSSCLQSFPTSGSFQMSQLFASGGQSIGVSASTSVLPMNTQDWSPLGWTGWISLQSKGLSRVFSQHHSSKASILLHSALFIVQLSHPYMTTGKTVALTRWTFADKVILTLT